MTAIFARLNRRARFGPAGSALVALLACAVFSPGATAQTPGSTFFGTRWDRPGPNAAVLCPPRAGAFGPGEANWSIMNPGIGLKAGVPDLDHPFGALSTAFDNLLPPPNFAAVPPTNVTRPAQLFQMALNIWQAGSGGAITFLPNVPDGGGLVGDTAANNANSGDIRVGVYQFLSQPPNSLANMDILAHGFYPNTDGANLLADGFGSVGGDIHFRPNSLYDPANGVQWWGLEGNAPGGSFDLLTVMIHEIGHAIGLGHNLGNAAADLMSVMQPTYAGVRRNLSASDIANVTQIYTAVAPAPGTAAGVLGLSMLVGARRRRR